MKSPPRRHLDRATNQRRAVEHACDRLQKEGVDYRPQELIDYTQ